MENERDLCMRCIQTVSAQRMTQAAASTVARLLKDGAAGDDVLVVTTTQHFKSALLTCDADVSAARVRTFQELTQDVLTCNGAAQKLGRSSRVLLPSEEKVLLEDLKVSGLKVNRLREMLKFFFRGITEGRDTEEGWLINNEEKSLLAFTQDSLKELGAILSCERSNLSCKCLDLEGVREQLGADHVVVCGFTSLDKCGQRLVRWLARLSLTCLGHPADDGCDLIAYPYAEGLGELVEAGATLEDVDAGCTGEADVLRSRISSLVKAETPFEPTKSQPRWANGSDPLVRVLATPEAERGYLVTRIQEELGGGAAPADILVVSPNQTFTKALCEDLGRAGVPAWGCVAPAYIKGDPRKTDSGALKFICGLNLVADPADVVAWRAWLGMGDWLLRSDAWQILRKIAGEQQVSMLEAIDLVRRGADPASGIELGPQALGALKLTGPIREADRLLRACEGLSGKQLLGMLEEISGWKIGHFERVMLQGCPGTAAAMLARLRDAVLDPHAPKGTLIVGQPESLRGMHAKTVLFCGMVNGYFPCYQAVDEDETHDKRRARARLERRRFLMALGLADECVAFSAFAESDLEFADRTKVDVGRIFVRAGSRRATAKPSVFLTECDPLD